MKRVSDHEEKGSGRLIVDWRDGSGTCTCQRLRNAHVWTGCVRMEGRAHRSHNQICKCSTCCSCLGRVSLTPDVCFSAPSRLRWSLCLRSGSKWTRVMRTGFTGGGEDLKHLCSGPSGVLDSFTDFSLTFTSLNDLGLRSASVGLEVKKRFFITKFCISSQLHLTAHLCNNVKCCRDPFSTPTSSFFFLYQPSFSNPVAGNGVFIVLPLL